MKEVRVEYHASESFIPEEEEEFDRLSFCNYLRLDENNSGGSTQHSRRNSSDHLFEFLISQPGPHAAGSDVIFCGRTIHEEEDEDQLNEYQKRDYFATIRSKSQSQSNRGSSFSDRRISSSSRISGDPNRSRCSSAGNLDYHAQRVNITSLTSMSAKSRRRMFMFGPVKFRPEMDLSAIKQRRAASVEKVAAAASGGGRSRWGVVRSSLRGRSHLTSVLARSLGCIPVVAGGGGGGGRWVGVAN